MTAFGVGRWARPALASAGALLLAAGLAACSGDTSTATSSADHSGAASTRTSPGSTEPTPPTTSPAAGTGTSYAPTAGSSAAPHTSGSPTSATSSATTSPESATAVKTFTPFDATGKPAIHIASTRSGYCFSVSIATSTKNAYRCMAHNHILDPCFAADGRASESVVCVPAPWEPGTKLTLNRRLPSIHRAGSTQPRWAIELDNGRRCVAVTGTVRFVGKIPLNYICGQDGGQAGDLRHEGTHWSVAYLPPHARTTHRVDVVTVWR